MKITAAFCVVLAIAGFAFLLGSVGAMDCNNISTAQGFIQCLIGLGATVGGGMFARLIFNEIEYRTRKERQR